MIPKLFKVISGKYVDDTLNYLLSHQGGGASVNTFTQDIVLTGNTIPLETGFYNTGSFGLFVGSQTPQNLIFGAGEIIYVDKDTLTIIGSLVSIAYDLIESVWTIQDNQKIENEVTNNRDKIPTSQAVYNGLAGKQNTLTAGQGIEISNNVISATGGGGGEESYAVNGSNPNVFTLSSTSNYEKIPMEIIDQIGNLFSTNSQGYIVANQDIDMALITFKAPLESANNTSVRYIRIAINDNVKAISFSTMNSNTKLNITIPNLLVTDIKQGDIITFEFYGYSGDKISNHNGQFTITSVLPSNPASNLNVTSLTQDIILTGNTIPLSTGFYNTGNYELFVGSQTPQNLIFGSNEIIYVDTSTLTIIGSLVSLSYDLSSSIWVIQDNQKIENEITNNRDKIPTSQAVYNKINEVSLIKATHTRQGIAIQTAWEQVQVPVDTENLLIGNDYTIANGSVIVGSKPKLVEINLSASMDTLSSGTYNVAVKVRRAGTTIKSSLYSFSGIANVWNPQIYMLAEVQEGDEISVWYTKNATGTFYFATLELNIKTLSEIELTTP